MSKIGYGTRVRKAMPSIKENTFNKVSIWSCLNSPVCKLGKMKCKWNAQVDDMLHIF